MNETAQQTYPTAIVVEDDNFLRVDVADMLDSFGYVVFEAENADAAVRLLEERGANVSLLFSDVDMPGSRNGFALAREIASRWPGVLIVIASGRFSPEPGDMPKGARFIGKPFSDQTVLDELRAIVPKHLQPDEVKMPAPL